jgi:hypothetical protein
MDAILIKDKDGSFHLSHVPSGWWIGETDHDKVKQQKGEQILSKLSLKNCQAIELGYDLDELAIECMKNTINQETGGDNHKLSLMLGFQKGFQKALELMGDKKFSEEDMLKAYNQGGNDGASHESACGDYDSYEEIEEAGQESEQNEKEFIQSLQQTEWEVIVEMEDIIHLKNRRGGLTNMGKPKLDADGCLILKRK